MDNPSASRKGAMPVVKPDGLSESAVAANTKMLSRSIRALGPPMWKFYREWEKQFTLVTQLTNRGFRDVFIKMST